MVGKSVAARVSEVALTIAEADAARGYAMAEKAEATRRGYRSDFGGFSRWCMARSVDPLPAAAGTVAAFLAAEATAGTKASTLSHKMASIRYAHRLTGHPSPTDIEQVRAVLQGIQREDGAAPHQKAAATVDRIKAMMDQAPETLKDKRDRALPALGMAGAFRRSELVALQVSDLERVPEGLRVTIRKSKTDQESIGDVIAILRGSKLKPVRAVLEWLDAAGITSGPVFRSVNRHGQVSAEGLSPQTVALVVKHYADAAGLDPDEFAGHSLRAGFLTSAAEADADVLRIMEVSRHKRVETVQSYVRRANMFRSHARAGFL